MCRTVKLITVLSNAAVKKFIFSIKGRLNVQTAFIFLHNSFIKRINLSYKHHIAFFPLLQFA